MQWTSASPNAGFTDEKIEPWMRVNTSAQDGINVSDEEGTKASVLHFWRRVLQTRKANGDVLVHGTFELVDAENPTVFSLLKKAANGRRALVVCNFSGAEAELPVIDGVDVARAKLLLGNVEQEGAVGVLKPWEGRVYAL